MSSNSIVCHQFCSTEGKQNKCLTKAKSLNNRTQNMFASMHYALCIVYPFRKVLPQRT